MKGACSSHCRSYLYVSRSRDGLVGLISHTVGLNLCVLLYREFNFEFNTFIYGNLYNFSLCVRYNGEGACISFVHLE